MRRATPLILLVEDYTDVREMYAEYLRFHGFDVEEAVDGIEAVEKTRALKPDLVLMDLALPRLDGWQATRALKQDKATAFIPIIALTSHAMTEHEVRTKASGADGFLRKPCLPDDLLAEVKRVLRLARGRREKGSVDN